MTDIRPFQINISEEIFDDLKIRLKNTHWPDEIFQSGWDYGPNLNYMKGLIEYWKDQFNWRAQEKFLNTFSHFTTNIDGLNIHFIHERGKGANPIPLIITHGWPSSFVEMTKIIPLRVKVLGFGSVY